MIARAATALTDLIQRREPVRPTLAEIARDRNNNFNLIRFTMALMVLVHHAFVLTGNPIQPANILLRGIANFGEIGVNGFFVVSGFLVTRSLFGRTTVGRFMLARVLRIFPGLWVMLIVTTIALASLSTLAPGAYFASGETFAYVARNATAFLITFDLPGLFDGHAVDAVNGSLWSLRYEMLCYVALAIAGITGLAQRRWPLAAVALGCAAMVALLPGDINYFLDLMRRLGLLFSLGACAAAYSHMIVLRLRYVAGLVAIALLCDGFAFAPVIWSLAFGYGLLWAAYVPKGAIRGFNRLPDVSYGLYIYAFPIQQAMIELGFGGTPASNAALALPLTILCATASWYGVEKPALEIKERLGRRRDPRVEA